MTPRERDRRAIGRRRKPRAARLLAVAGLLLAASVGAVTGAAPSMAAACTSSAGVTVVVDYGSLGGTSVGCASSPGSGIGALQGTGHTVTYVPRQPGLVCTIDRRPDPCNGAPTSAYWSYWHAVPGGSWSYSTMGAASTRPKSGTVEGWAFGAGKPPAMRPPSRPRPTTSSTTSRPSPRTTTSRPPSTAAARPSAARTTITSSSTARTTAAASPTSGPASAATTAATTTGSASVDAGGGAPTSTGADAAAPTSATSPSSGAGTLVVAALLVLVLAGGGGVIAWRRRGSGA